MIKGIHSLARDLIFEYAKSTTTQYKIHKDRVSVVNALGLSVKHTQMIIGMLPLVEDVDDYILTHNISSIDFMDVQEYMYMYCVSMHHRYNTNEISMSVYDKYMFSSILLLSILSNTSRLFCKSITLELYKIKIVYLLELFDIIHNDCLNNTVNMSTKICGDIVNTPMEVPHKKKLPVLSNIECDIVLVTMSPKSYQDIIKAYHNRYETNAIVSTINKLKDIGVLKEHIDSNELSVTKVVVNTDVYTTDIEKPITWRSNTPSVDDDILNGIDNGYITKSAMTKYLGKSYGYVSKMMNRLERSNKIVKTSDKRPYTYAIVEKCNGNS